MAALEFKFSSDQQHQLEAIEATCDLFRGQQFIGSVFSADSGRKGQTAIGGEYAANKLLSAEQVAGCFDGLQLVLLVG